MKVGKNGLLMQDGRTVSVTGSSVGGGEIEILEKRYGSLF